MAYAGYDAELMGTMDRSSATPGQLFLVQAILRGLEPDTYLSHYAAYQRGVLPTVHQAMRAMKGFGSNNQPQYDLTRRLCRCAQVAAETAVRIGPASLCTSRLASILTDAMSLTDGDRSDFITAAGKLESELPAIHGYLDDLFRRAWRKRMNSDSDWQFLEYAANELVCAVAARDRDRRTLDRELASLLRGDPSTEAVLSCLLPPPRRFQHACIVEGARTLRDLHLLSPGAELLTGPGKTLPWGPANGDLKSWLDREFKGGNRLALSLPVDACDRASAARLGRRAVIELLDQYVAGHRLVALRVTDVGFTCEVGEAKTAEYVAPARSVHYAYPLTQRWPRGLREPLRMAHLARAADSPLVTVLLAWSAIEACGLPADDRRRLANALSLQILRQQLVDAFMSLSQDIATRNSWWSTRLDRHRADIARVEHVMDGLPYDHDAQDGLIAQHHEITSQLSEAEEWEARLAPAVAALAEIHQSCRVDAHGLLGDLNTWVDALMPERASEAAAVTATRRALKVVAQHLTPMSRRNLQVWKRRLGDCGELADWLDLSRAQANQLLDSIYAARNLTVHAGVLSMPGDTVLGQGAEMMVDMTLEFIGNWYRHETKPTGQLPSPIKVIPWLASRQELLVEAMRSQTGSAFQLNPEWLTSPSSTGWDRA